jgi:hypothetical protein
MDRAAVRRLKMPLTATSYPLRDVLAYPSHMLHVEDGRITVGARYRRTWQDGFGARGWKLNSALDDPEIIASTREAGGRIATSVFVHDVLDHLLSGFAPSGHRAEAMALVQLGERTGSDIRGDHEQMVREDLLAGRAQGESLLHFLGTRLLSLAETDPAMEPGEIIRALHEHMGEQPLVQALIERFESLGREGRSHALHSWYALGLPHHERGRIGLALQRVLAQADAHAQDSALDDAEARIRISAYAVALEVIYPWKRQVFSTEVEFDATADDNRHRRRARPTT